MKTIKDFRFNDVVLYSKGWYEHTDDFMKDLEKYIRMNEDYCYPPQMTDIDIMNYMLKALDAVYEHCDSEELKNPWLCHSHASFLERVRHEMTFYNDSFEKAVCGIVYSILQGLDRKQIELNRPRYDKNHRYGGGFFSRGGKKGMTYKEMYRRWDNLDK